MADIDWDDPEIEAQWLSERRTIAEQYLREQKVPFGAIEADPAWAAVPYVALWRVLGPRSGEPTFWTITGDFPTDFLPTDGAATPRLAAAAFAERWQAVAGYMLQGKAHPTIQIGPRQDREELGELLQSRAALLAEWATDDDNW